MISVLSHVPLKLGLIYSAVDASSALGFNVSHVTQPKVSDVSFPPPPPPGPPGCGFDCDDDGGSGEGGGVPWSILIIAGVACVFLGAIGAMAACMMTMNKKQKVRG